MRKLIRSTSSVFIFNLFLGVFTFCSFQLNAQTFTEQTGISLTGVSLGSSAWGDYDNDGDLDILITGDSTTSNPVSVIYRNDGNNTFTEQTGIALMGVGFSASAWGDYDNDGDLDILITGINSSGRFSKIYRNDGLIASAWTFTEQTSISLVGVSEGSVDWGDYNNDGNLDILLAGNSNAGYTSRIYKNNGNNTFIEETGVSLPGFRRGTARWGDYDNDGDLDIFLTGEGLGAFYIYRNEGPISSGIGWSFAHQSAIIINRVDWGGCAWGDYDNDGDLDLLISGYNDAGRITKIYKNNGNNTFSEQTSIYLVGVNVSCVAWGDYDNDGYLDILLTGHSDVGETSKIYKNNGNNSFTEQTSISLTNASGASVKWGDYDNDGDLDILFTGGGNGTAFSKIYKNNTIVSNAAPTAPTGLTSQIVGDKLRLTWNKATDDSTSSDGLSYNIAIGASLSDVSIKAPQSDLSSGFHRVADQGMIQDTFYIMKVPDNISSCSKIYWSVQAIDAGFKASPFSASDSINNTLLIQATTANDTIFPYDTVQLGVTHNACGSVTYSWSPTAVLDNPNIQNPKATINKPTTFYVTLTEGTVSRSDSVTVNVDWFPEESSISISGVEYGDAAWGDYDNDGDLDIILTGYSNSGTISKIYRNDSTSSGRSFQQTGVSLTGVFTGSVQWGDYDNDGDLDLIVTGYDDSFQEITKIYTNNGANSGWTFTEKPTNILGISYGMAVWGDYDNDGDLDILLTGQKSNNQGGSKLYTNQGVAHSWSFSENTSISLLGEW